MKFKRTDLGFFSFHVNFNGTFVYPDWDGTLRVEFYDSSGTLKYTATTTSSPALLRGSDANGNFVYINGLDITSYPFGLVTAKIYANYSSSNMQPYPTIEDAFIVISGEQPINCETEFCVSQLADLIVEFNNTGVPFDPLDIQWVKIIDPNGNVLATLTPSRISLGKWHVRYFIPSSADPGSWTHLWSWKASPSVDYIEQSYSFTVIPGTGYTVTHSFVGLGCSSTSTINPIWAGVDSTVMTLKRIPKRLKIFFTRGGIPFNPALISVIVERDGRDVFTGSLATGEIKSDLDGIFYLDLAASFFAYAPRYYTLKWVYSESVGAESVLAVSRLFVLNTYVYEWLPRLRLQVDKSMKVLDSNFVGYTDAQLFYFLQGGLDEINMFPPTTGFMLDNWPSTYGQLLIDSGTIVAMISQKLYSVDTDVMNYSDQGFNYTLDHFARLGTVMTEMLAHTKDNLNKLKWEFNQLGSINVQVVPYYPLGVLLKTAPRGGLFRNLFASG